MYDHFLNAREVVVDRRLAKMRRASYPDLLGLVVVKHAGGAVIVRALDAEAVVAKTRGDVTVAPYTGPLPVNLDGSTEEWWND